MPFADYICSPSNGGSIQQLGSQKMVAKPAPCYEFSHWTIWNDCKSYYNDLQVTTDTFDYDNIVATIAHYCSTSWNTPTLNFTAHFTKVNDCFALTTSVNESVMGCVNGGGSYGIGDTAVLNAVSNTGCRFIKWNDGITQNPRNVIVTQDTSFKAIFGIDSAFQPVYETPFHGRNAITFKMMKVDGGTFQMGSTTGEDDEKPVHTVTLSTYYIGETEVTQALWKKVMGSNPSTFIGDSLPVQNVSWNDCQTFITKLNQMTGRTFTLPTEAQWEFAARGGTKSLGYQYSGSDTLNNVAWYADNSYNQVHSVGTKQDNELGVYDMFGNVWEWCNDRWGNYSSASQTNPTGCSSSSCSARVYRGGCWNYGAGGITFANRNCYQPTQTYRTSADFGLRLALVDANEVDSMIVVETPGYLCFTAVYDTSTVKLNKVGTPNSINLQYSLDDCLTWNTYVISQTITLPVGKSVFFKATSTNSLFSKGGNDYYNFDMTGFVEASGNAMSLLDATMKLVSVPSYAFYSLFENCSSLLTPPTLSARTVSFGCYQRLFENCTNLKTPTELPALIMANNCYHRMFRGCSSLQTAPALPSTSLAPLCYADLFFDCNSLKEAPELPATTLADKCYYTMFRNCSTLVNPPVLPATNLAAACYTGMFMGCSNLISTPNLPAMEMAPRCYGEMFKGCSNLSAISSLPATSLADSCYHQMFWGCVSLTKLPVLPATALYEKCYSEMFRGCTSIRLNTEPSDYLWKIPGNAVEASDWNTDMFVGTSGTFNGSPVKGTDYYIEGGIVMPDYLTFTARNGNVTVRFDIKNVTHTIQYSTDGISWTNYVSNTDIALNEDEKVYFRAESDQTNAVGFGNTTVPTCSRFYFTSTDGGMVEASGNIMSLYGPSCPDITLPSNAFRDIFQGCSLLTTPPLLPSTKLGYFCYGGMFNGCTSLTSAPALPATELTIYCYGWMFYQCTSLATAPSLPATTLTEYCYREMFHGCSLLTEAPLLPATNLATLCYFGMFADCDKITTAPELPAETMQSGCYQCMFDRCSNLKVIPNIPANTLADSCFKEMFRDCSLIRLNETGSGTPWLIPNEAASSASTSLKWGNDMFLRTSGDLQGAPVVGHNYYPVLSVKMSLAVNDSSMGTVSGEGWYAQCSSVTIEATPIEHHHFVNWSNGSKDAITTITITSDTLLTATFAVNPTYFFAETQAICQGNTYSWRGRNLTSSGIYYDSLTTIYGEDSVYQLTLTVNPTYIIQEAHTICQGQTYNWHNRALTAAGVYYDSLLTGLGCDSVYELTLTVNPTYFIEEAYTICQGQTYNWHNRALTEAGVYYDSLTTLLGCDSVYELTLTVNPTYFIQESHTICQGETYNWHNRALTAAGTYYDSLQTLAGCDSVYELTLTVNPTYFIEEAYTICQGETYNWHNRALTTAGVYYDSLLTGLGCDSVFELTLTVNPTYFIEEAHTICQGQTYNWHNRSLTTAGVYYDSLQTGLGCDSVYQLTLTVNPTYLIQESDVICHGNIYNWHNMTITAAGVYYDSLLTVSGCDSVYELTLTINSYSVTANVNDANMGSVGGAGTYECGTTVTLSATANDCHRFVNWSDGNEDNPRIFTVTEDTSFTAIFEIIEYTISASSNDAKAGKAYFNISNGEVQQTTVNCGESVMLVVEPYKYYHFVEWSDGVVDSARTIEITSDTNIIAKFEPNCGEMAEWPVVFKYNSLFILNIDSIQSMGYDPQPEEVSWWKVMGEPDDLNASFPADDQFVCNGHYMSLITNNLSYGKYYAVVDVSKETATLCNDKMRTEVVEYSYNGQRIRVELAPTDVKNGDVMTVSGLVPYEETTLMVYDYSGKVVETIKSSGSERCQITATGSAGVYMVNVISDSVNETVKFIVTK